MINLLRDLLPDPSAEGFGIPRLNVHDPRTGESRIDSLEQST